MGKIKEEHRCEHCNKSTRGLDFCYNCGMSVFVSPIKEEKCDYCGVGEQLNGTRCKDCPPYNPNPRFTGEF